MKKTIGIILLGAAVFAVIGGIAEGTLFSVSGGAAYAAGQLLGQLLGFGLMIGGGIALIKSSKK